VVPEDALTGAFDFLSAYERSKYEGECLVQAARSDLPISIFRPGMVVGDSRTGAVKTFNTIYVALRRYLTGKLPVLPASPALRLNIVPVDYVADATARLTFEPAAAGLTFHLTAPQESLPTAGELVDFTRRWARKRLGLRLRRPLFIPPAMPAPWEQFVRRQILRRTRRRMFGELATVLPYLHEQRQFQRDNVDRLLGPYTLQWRTFMPSLLEYAVAKGFMHDSERTVHEQVLFRLAHTGKPVTHHDLVDGKTITRDAAQVRREILAAAQSLRSFGVQPGDRVALVGHNSTRYLTLDVAIGLVGAVSVPLYYTSPQVDLDAMLTASGAQLLLLGAPKLLQRLDELRAALPVVSFCREAVPPHLVRSVMAWDEFLARGAAGATYVTAPVGFDAPATLRYTSGTTGAAKGAVFTHAQLRWLAECTASLLPWQARTSAATYLSFLPMNHVVEGILAAYAPYYLPAPLEIYFLEDFTALQQILPHVRPTIFFSVPRLYEKVWDALQNSRIGQAYLQCPHGLRKKLLRPLVRRGLLRRAGLDRCAQLIVGSAPSSADLLDAYLQLGIAVHNAYGLTEAPLVSLNRRGANRVGTVGQPLPGTDLRLAADGEVLVRGPQVMTGYFEQGSASPFTDGWLCTGDLGQLTDDGYLVIHGRKKELIATSYAKKIQPAKIEALLREIPGVSEAMVVGEARPYCSAVLWVNERCLTGAATTAIDRGVATVNTHLSHAEQVKRWAILSDDLSIEAGDLTANLKLKREAIISRRQAVLAALYSAETSRAASDHLLHVGKAEQEKVPR
jgi:long-chain acyl-CoA synthetase